MANETFVVKLIGDGRQLGASAPVLDFEFASFDDCVKWLRWKYPKIDFAESWIEWPRAINGDQRSELSFGDGVKQLGWLWHNQFSTNSYRRN